jgi:hypothetical protein
LAFPTLDLKLSLCDGLYLFDFISSSYMKLPISLKQIEMQICVIGSLAGGGGRLLYLS